MYLQEKAHSNMCSWILSQTYPGQRALTAYLQSSIKGAPKQPNSSPAARQLTDHVIDLTNEDSSSDDEEL